MPDAAARFCDVQALGTMLITLAKEPELCPEGGDHRRSTRIQKPVRAGLSSPASTTSIDQVVGVGAGRSLSEPLNEKACSPFSSRAPETRL